MGGVTIIERIRESMRPLIIYATVLTFSLFSQSIFANEGDGPSFIQALKFDSISCTGQISIGNAPLSELGKVTITIENKRSENPVIDVLAKGIHFKIGDGFHGGLNRLSDSCRYYSTKDKVFYVCGLTDAQRPIDFLQVTRADIRSSFGIGVVCASRGSGSCIHLTSCSN